MSALLIGTKFSWRSWTNFRAAIGHFHHKPCVIYGAGMAGELLARHVFANPNFPFRVVGFIDDDKNKIGRIIHGFKVLGRGDNLAYLAERHGINAVIVALHSAPGNIMRQIVEKCRMAGLETLVMPDMANSLASHAIQPRRVDVKDLLRRSLKAIDEGKINNYFRNNKVLITGAGGSIGSELCRQVVEKAPCEIIVVDSSEYNLYQIDLELREKCGQNTKIHSVLGSVADSTLVEEIFSTYKPSTVLHAAAYKHVPLIESNPVAATLNNLISTKLLCDASIHHGVEKFLLISSDKAVRPANVMGATKRVCELIVQLAQAKSRKTKFCSVRFGNVLGSSGSVIPRFMQQIQAGGPVTVTHPEVTRYFMLTSEAVGLVLQSIAMSEGGEVFILNMGEPVNIYKMAEQLILLAGKTPGKDIEIAVTGLRPGEKLYEELILEGSESQTQHEDIFIAKPHKLDGASLERAIEDVLSAAIARNENKCVELLKKTITDDCATAFLPASRIPADAGIIHIH